MVRAVEEFDARPGRGGQGPGAQGAGAGRPVTAPRREIGFWTAVSLVVGGMIGSGVFMLPAALARYGGLSLIGWVVSAAGSILLALVFAHLARRNPAAGGVYAYTRDSFGDLAGFLVAWGYWISIWCANAALAVAFAGYFEPLLPWSYLRQFWWMPAPGHAFGAGLAIATRVVPHRRQ